jgi:hypothetical protein
MSPFKSESQRRKFAELVKQGKMSPDTFKTWNSETTGKLPERVGKPSTKGQAKNIKPVKAK